MTSSIPSSHQRMTSSIPSGTHQGHLYLYQPMSSHVHQHRWMLPATSPSKTWRRPSRKTSEYPSQSTNPSRTQRSGDTTQRYEAETWNHGTWIYICRIQATSVHMRDAGMKVSIVYSINIYTYTPMDVSNKRMYVYDTKKWYAFYICIILLCKVCVWCYHSGCTCVLLDIIYVYKSHYAWYVYIYVYIYKTSVYVYIEIYDRMCICKYIYMCRRLVYIYDTYIHILYIMIMILFYITISSIKNTHTNKNK